MEESVLNFLKSTPDPAKWIKHGLEKECLRVNEKGFLSSKPHPKGLGSKLTHPYITTDYSENLLEFITPPFHSTSKLLDFLEELHVFVEENLEGEFLWPNSMPGIIEKEEDIPVANYGTSNTGRLKTLYRVGLGHRYGKSMQTIAGIHFNFSYDDDFWNHIRGELSLREVKDKFYMNLMRNFRRYSYILKYFYGASPVVHESFLKGKKHDLVELGQETFGNPQGLSLRMGGLGYTSNAQKKIQICFNEVSSYISTLENARLESFPAYEKIGLVENGERKQLNTNLLQIDNEYYSTIRPKNIAKSGESALQALHRGGIEYIEVRLTDLNPFERLGVTEEQLLFYKVFLSWCMFTESESIDFSECRKLKERFGHILENGQAIDSNEFRQSLDELQVFAKIFGEEYESVVTKVVNRKPLALEVFNYYKQNGYAAGNIKLMLSHRQKGKEVENREELMKVTSESVEKQKELEDADNLNFDDFLVHYFEGIKI